jgi:hypothetical protein
MDVVKVLVQTLFSLEPISKLIVGNLLVAKPLVAYTYTCQSKAAPVTGDAILKS